MIPLDLIFNGFHSLARKKFRTFLTLLGVIFGVGAVIAMVSIGGGAREETLKIIETFGIDTMTIKSVTLDNDRREEALRLGSVGLCAEDGRLARAILPVITDISVQQRFAFRGRYQEKDFSASIMGVEENYLRMTRLPLRRGRPFLREDFLGRRRVCVIGGEINDLLFAKGEAVGQNLIIGPQQFEIIGVMERRETQGATIGGKPMAIKNRDINKDIYIPMGAGAMYLPPPRDPFPFALADEIIIRVRDKEWLKPTRDAIQKILGRRHRGINDFEILVPLEMLEQSQETLKIFNWVMVFIASLSLLVGGIGIMNIMLATVSERTREIGIRRAIGASSRDILWQFLAESTLISLLGGLIGIAVGRLMSVAISRFAGWPTLTPPGAILLAFSTAALVGVIFGIFPASQAARLDPIEALRHE